MRMTAADKLKAAQMARAASTGVNPYFVKDDQLNSAQLTAEQGDFGFYLEQLKIDRAYIASLTTLEEKQAAKMTRLPTYYGHLNAYMTRGDCYPNKVLTVLMIWMFDVGNIEQGLQLGCHLCKQGCHIMPRNFERDLPTFICDAMYDWAIELYKKDHSAEPYLADVVAAMDAQAWCLSPPVQSKMYVALAKHKAKINQWADVAALCMRAQVVNPEGHGTKTLAAQAAVKMAPQAQPDAED